MNHNVRIFKTPYELAEKFAGELVQMIKEAAEDNMPLNVALSGGSTPELLFSILGDHYSNSAPWEFVHFFWGDERCVPPVSPDSNFGMAFRTLFKKIRIPEKNVHRIYGEKEPVSEAIRYSDLITNSTKSREGLPVFDLVLLGLGADGHTASIFPGMNHLFKSEKICEVALHPVSHQKRITVTGRILNNADKIRFLVTGKSKASILKAILKKDSGALNLPASLVVSVNGSTEWLIDAEAGSLL